MTRDRGKRQKTGTPRPRRNKEENEKSNRVNVVRGSVSSSDSLNQMDGTLTWKG